MFIWHFQKAFPKLPFSFLYWVYLSYSSNLCSKSLSFKAISLRFKEIRSSSRCMCMAIYRSIPANCQKNIDLNTMELNRSGVSEKVYRRRFWNICRCLPFVSNRQRPQKELSDLGSCLSSCQFVFARRTNMLLESSVSPHWGSCYWHCF